MGALLRSANRAFAERIHQGLTQGGFTDLRPPHLVVFQHMRAEGRRSTELAEQAQMTKQSMGYLIDYLEERGYLAREADPLDGRARIIKLTGRGEEVERVAREVAAEIEADWARLLGHDRMEELHQSLADLTDMLEG